MEPGLWSDETQIEVFDNQYPQMAQWPQNQGFDMAKSVHWAKLQLNKLLGVLVWD